MKHKERPRIKAIQKQNEEKSTEWTGNQMSVSFRMIFVSSQIIVFRLFNTHCKRQSDKISPHDGICGRISIRILFSISPLDDNQANGIRLLGFCIAGNLKEADESIEMCLFREIS